MKKRHSVKFLIFVFAVFFAAQAYAQQGPPEPGYCYQPTTKDCDEVYGSPCSASVCFYDLEEQMWDCPKVYANETTDDSFETYNDSYYDPSSSGYSTWEDIERQDCGLTYRCNCAAAGNCGTASFWPPTEISAPKWEPAMPYQTCIRFE